MIARLAGKTGGRLIGLAFLLVIALLLWLSLALYSKDFTSVAWVTLRTGSVGNEMHPGAQVLVRGVQVGEVRTISSNGSGATLRLAIQPNLVNEIPANVTAEMLPTTLFGQRYVDLVLPASPVTQRLGNGSVIRQDQSKDGIEVETLLNNLLPELTAVQPQNLSITLTAISQALQGRGPELGQTLVRLNAYLHKLNPTLPALDNDIRRIASVTRSFAQAAPDIAQALNDFAITSQTIVAEQENLSALYGTLTQAAGNLNTFLNQNSGNIIGLSTNGLPTLQILARYSSEIPCVLNQLVKFEPDINRVLGAGTSQPGLHVHVDVQQPLGNAAEPNGNYLSNRDTPVFGDNSGPHCYPIPFSGVALNDGTSPVTNAGPLASGTAASAAGGTADSASSLSLVNSPQENELVNEISAPALGVQPRALPGWSSVLVGPLYRGREVQLG
jgi:phospholipid/cholesterol/gamma-HCH transport system substrate-binding protein